MTITTDTMPTTDVRAAMYAALVNQTIRIDYSNNATPARVIADEAAEEFSVYPRGTSLEHAAYIEERTALYERGAALLTTHRIVKSARTHMLTDFDERRFRETHPGICSDMVTQDCGYQAGSQTWCLVALVRK